MKTKTEKQEHKSPEELKAKMAEEKDMADDKACADELEAVLNKYERAIQNFLSYSEFGVSPRSRLVKHTPEKKDEQGS